MMSLKMWQFKYEPNLTYASQAKTGTESAKTTPPPGASPETTKKGKEEIACK